MQYRYHPIIEGLKVNEDGSEITLNGQPLKIATQVRYNRKNVYLGNKTVSTVRLVCEAWHGPAPTGEHAARRINENGGDHYTNIAWGKKGNIQAALKTWNKRGSLITAEVYEAIQERLKTEKITHILADLKISEGTYYRYVRTYVEKD